EGSGSLLANGTGSWLVQGSHTWEEETNPNQPLEVVVTLTNPQDPSNPQSVSVPVTVADAALSATGVSLSAWAGSPTGTVVVANLQDANPFAGTADFTANVTWGDGDSSGALVWPRLGGGFQVVAGHTYQTAGHFTAHVTIRDDGGQTASADTSVDVSAAQ